MTNAKAIFKDLGIEKLGDFADVPTPDPASEIHLIQTFADTRVIGLTINHEHMTDAEVDEAIANVRRHHRPVVGTSHRGQPYAADAPARSRALGLTGICLGFLILYANPELGAWRWM